MTTEKFLNWVSENWWVLLILGGGLCTGVVKIIEAVRGDDHDYAKESDDL